VEVEVNSVGSTIAEMTVVYVYWIQYRVAVEKLMRLKDSDEHSGSAERSLVDLDHDGLLFIRVDMEFLGSRNDLGLEASQVSWAIKYRIDQADLVILRHMVRIVTVLVLASFDDRWPSWSSEYKAQSVVHTSVGLEELARPEEIKSLLLFSRSIASMLLFPHFLETERCIT
jgi:hypothetical protein